MLSIPDEISYGRQHTEEQQSAKQQQNLLKQTVTEFHRIYKSQEYLLLQCSGLELSPHGVEYAIRRSCKNGPQLSAV